MDSNQPDVLVLRKGTEGLAMEDYAAELSERLPQFEVRLARTPKAERSLITHASVVTGVDIDDDLLTRAEQLRLFACIYAGYEHLPLDALAEEGVAVTNASGIHAPAIAEQVIGFMLVFARRIHEGLRRKQRAEWRHYKAFELGGSTVTIVGLGSIGTEVVERLDGFNVHTIGVRYTPEKGGPTDEVIGFDDDDIHEALAQTEYLILASPLTEETRGLIGEDEFSTLPPNAVIINVARGQLINATALEQALQKEQIRGGAFDVTDPEPLPADHTLWGLENVIITPHMGGHTPEHWPRLAEIVANNVAQLQKTKRPTDLQNQVLVPES